MLFKFRIYGKHERQEIGETGELLFTPISDDWNAFHIVLNTDYTVITSFRSYVLFDSENNPTECTLVNLSDGSILFATNKLESFEANYIEFLKAKAESEANQPAS